MASRLQAEKGKILPQTLKKIRHVLPESSRILSKMNSILPRTLPLISLIIPIVILYSLYPYSFEPTWTGTWKNRIYYVFFLWLLSLQTILNWEDIQAKGIWIRNIRTVVFAIALLLPTIYVLVANYLGLNALITSLATQNNIGSGWAELMPLSVEYLVFAILSSLIILLAHGISGLNDHSISTVFLAMIGGIYTIDNMYPFGQFSPFQVLVLPTATLAAGVLTFMGYSVLWLSTVGGMPVYRVTDMLGRSSPRLGIAWPCSGIESLLIYTVTVLLFLKKSTIPLKRSIIYLLIGGIVTYFINILRIVTIFVIAVNNGDWGIFHDYYGSLYSITWIICYPVIIIGTEALGKKITNWKQSGLPLHRESTIDPAANVSQPRKRKAIDHSY